MFIIVNIKTNPSGNWSCVFCKGISVPSAGIIARSTSNSRDILLQKANKVINNGEFVFILYPDQKSIY